jgi:histidine phosphotransferase ChpT
MILLLWSRYFWLMITDIQQPERHKMSNQACLSDIELAALVSSKVCHDVVGPIGAIGNGLEVLADTDDDSMRKFALDMIAKSTRTASAKLQFSRLAFGAAGGPDGEIDLRDAEAMAKGYVGDERHNLIWNATPAIRPKNEVKLLLNMIAIAMGTLPRGGDVVVSVENAGTLPRLEIRCTGQKARVSENVKALLEAENGQAIDARSVQAYYAGCLARAANMNLTIDMDGEDVVLLAA